jgi:DNA-binding cell septation regulator SpoVG
MTVTAVKTNNIEPKETGICGEFTITLDDAICIHKIYVVSGDKGLFITFPNTGEMKMYKRSKRYFDIVHPTNKTIRELIEKEVLKKYNEELAKLN